jgi:hypothetical protein
MNMEGSRLASTPYASHVRVEIEGPEGTVTTRGENSLGTDGYQTIAKPELGQYALSVLRSAGAGVIEMPAATHIFMTPLAITEFVGKVDGGVIEEINAVAVGVYNLKLSKQAEQ